MHARRFGRPTLAALIGGSLVMPMPASSQAADIVSTYTSTAKKDCRTIGKAASEDDGFVHLCPGPGKLVVLNMDGDLREVVSVGTSRATAEKQPAAQAWFAPFSSTTRTIEWRHAKGAAPFAIIQRWHLADNDDPGPDHRPQTKQMLVVTRLPPGPVCHMAFVDVAANPDANDLARKAADAAAAFDCAKDKVRVAGRSGRAIELAMPR